jgi:hypothetical protein
LRINCVDKPIWYANFAKKFQSCLIWKTKIIINSSGEAKSYLPSSTTRNVGPLFVWTWISDIQNNQDVALTLTLWAAEIFLRSIFQCIHSLPW